MSNSKDNRGSGGSRTQSQEKKTTPEDKMFGDLMKAESKQADSKATETKKKEPEVIRVRFLENWFGRRFYHAGEVARVYKKEVLNKDGNMLKFVKQVDDKAMTKQYSHEKAQENPYGKAPLDKNQRTKDVD